MGKNAMEQKYVIAEAYKTYKLHTYPIFVTGYRCIGRGISLQSNDFIFDYGIIPQLSTKICNTINLCVECLAISKHHIIIHQYIIHVQYFVV